TSSPNGAPEGYAYNDTARSNLVVVTGGSNMLLPVEDFDHSALFPPAGWSLNSSNPFSWGRTRLASSSGIHSAAKNCFNDFNVGTVEDLELPVVDCSTAANAVLEFNYAYSGYPGYYDSLQVMVSSDCGLSWDIVYYSGGEAMATAPAAGDA